MMVTYLLAKVVKNYIKINVAFQHLVDGVKLARVVVGPIILEECGHITGTCTMYTCMCMCVLYMYMSIHIHCKGQVSIYFVYIRTIALLLGC